MEITFKDTTDLAEKILKINDVETVAKAIEAYGNKRHEIGLNSGWRNATLVFRRLRERNSEKRKNQILEWDDINSCVDFIGITNYVTSVLDEIKKVGIDAKHEETIDALELIEDYMLEKLGKGISTDRRLLFSLKHKEKKHQQEVENRTGSK